MVNLPLQLQVSKIRFLTICCTSHSYFFLVIKECYKAGFRWREVGFPVQPTLTAPEGFQLSSFHGERPIYRSDPTTTIPTGVVSNSDSAQPTYLPDWEPRPVVWDTPTGASPFGLGPVPPLPPLPTSAYRPAVESGVTTKVATKVDVPKAGSSKVSRSAPPAATSKTGPTTVSTRSRGGNTQVAVAGPSRMLQARAPSTFVSRGVPGTSRVNVDLVRPFTFQIFIIDETTLFNIIIKLIKIFRIWCPVNNWTSWMIHLVISIALYCHVIE